MSVWVASRAAGLGALWLLAASAALGYAARLAGSVRPRWVRPLQYLHTALAVAGWLGAWVHVLLLRYDDFMPFGWKDLFVPFRASYRPVWTGLGILSLYGWGFTLVAFDARRSLGAQAFKAAHRLAPAVLALAGLHALGAGSDRQLASLWWGGWLLALMGFLLAMSRLGALARRPAAWRGPSGEAVAGRLGRALPGEGVREAHAGPRGGR